ncbi:MAG: anaerobic ribonucleoside-triphosphate reductase activating protein, partial [Clostridia bacterium]|nr:anaerobic ribonucleoside-triphosphate reductase activating protein [Clostridia bacterium]
ETVGVGNFDIAPIEKSISLLMTKAQNYEFRTTLVKELHDTKCIQDIGEWIKGAKAMHIQQFKDSGDIISSGFSAPSDEFVKLAEEILSKYVKYVSIRG